MGSKTLKKLDKQQVYDRMLSRLLLGCVCVSRACFAGPQLLAIYSLIRYQHSFSLTQPHAQFDVQPDALYALYALCYCMHCVIVYALSW